MREYKKATAVPGEKRSKTLIVHSHSGVDKEDINRTPRRTSRVDRPAFNRYAKGQQNTESTTFGVLVGVLIINFTELHHTFETQQSYR